MGKQSLFWVALLSLTLMVPASSMGTPLTPAFENLTPDRGFGDTMNRYSFSMAEFQGNVYVGTWNVQLDYPQIIQDVASGALDLSNIQNPLNGIRYLESNGGEIWRSSGGNSWSQVRVPSSMNDTGFRKMIEYNGQLYAGSANSAEGTKLYRSSDGTAWEEVTGGPTGNPDNNSNRAMAVYDGELYVGVENNNTGGELWKYSDTSGWDLVNTFADDSSVSEISVFDNTLYVGTWDFTDSFSFYEMTGANTFENRTPTASDIPDLADLNNLGVMKLVEYKGQFYLGTVNYQDGFTLMRTTTPDDPTSWQVLTTDGFGDPSNAYSWAITEWQGKLYLGTFNSGLYGGLYGPVPLDGRAELWCSSDGEHWDILMDDGFDSRFTYGIRNILATEDTLYFGTASNFFIYDPDEWGPELAALIANLELTEEELARVYAFMGKIGSHFEGDWIGTEVYGLTHSAPVPEPSTVLLLGLGMVGFAAYSRKKWMTS